mmetsp:Transcript_6938/g.28461  ORF Transcript_6938/g.28461 Transcript_6938/m.28461 type:complete len:219 (+) Transcript_6938:4941-5597(+)
MPSWHGLPPGRRSTVRIKPPSHMSKRPLSVPLNTLPSGISAYPATSERSSFPNLPMSPCSLRPVKVSAIFQKRMWPVPDVVSCPSKKGEKVTSNTSCENAFERNTMASSLQSHTVSQKSGYPPTVASFEPSLEKRPQLYARSVPPTSTRFSFSVSVSYMYTPGFTPFSPSAKCVFSGCTTTNPTPSPSMPYRYVCSPVPRCTVCTIAPTVKMITSSER